MTLRCTKAAALAAMAVAAAASGVHAAISVHVTSPWLNMWVIWNNTSVTDVNPAGTAGHLSTMQTGLTGSMDMFSLALPAFQGAPTAPLMGSEVDMFMNSFDIVGGLGGPLVQTANWGIWVTGRGWGVHITIGGTQLLPSSGVEPDGSLRYSTVFGQDFFANVDYTKPDGSHFSESLFADGLEFSAPFPLPAPSAAAMLGLGGLMAARRRRA